MRVGHTSSRRPPSTRRCSIPAACSPQHGYRVTVLPVDGEGPRRPRRPRAGLRARHAAGVDHARQQRDRHGAADIAAIAALCRERGVLCHTDATQTIGRLPFDVERARRRPRVASPATRCTGRRAPAASTSARARPRCCRCSRAAATSAACAAARSTCPASSASAEALALAVAELPQDAAHTRRLRDRLWTALREAAPGGAPHRRRSRRRSRPPAAQQPARHARRRRRRPHRGRRSRASRARRDRRAPAAPAGLRTSLEALGRPEAARRCASASAGSPPRTTSRASPPASCRARGA